MFANSMKGCIGAFFVWLSSYPLCASGLGLIIYDIAKIIFPNWTESMQSKGQCQVT